MKKIFKSWVLEAILVVLLAIAAIATGYAVGVGKTTSKYAYDDNNPPATLEIKFKHTGTAGSLTTLHGDYNVALNWGDDYDLDYGQKLVDFDYSALIHEDHLVDDDNNYTDDKIKVVLDHNYGIPAALPAIERSDYLWIQDKSGKVTGYEKVATFVTGNRETKDLLTSNGVYVRNENFVKNIGNPDKMLMFITCKGDGRLVSFWQETNSKKSHS